MEGRKKVGYEGPVQPDEGTQQDVLGIAFRDCRAGQRGQVPNVLDGQALHAPEDHETDLAAEYALDEVLEVLDPEARADLESKKASTEGDTEKGRQGPGHAHEGVLPNYVGRRLPEHPAGDVAAQGTTDRYQRGLRSQRSTGCDDDS